MVPPNPHCRDTGVAARRQCRAVLDLMLPNSWKGRRREKFSAARTGSGGRRPGKSTRQWRGPPLAAFRRRRRVASGENSRRRHARRRRLRDRGLETRAAEGDLAVPRVRRGRTALRWDQGVRRGNPRRDRDSFHAFRASRRANARSDAQTFATLRRRSEKPRADAFRGDGSAARRRVSLRLTPAVFGGGRPELPAARNPGIPPSHAASPNSRSAFRKAVSPPGRGSA